MPGETLTVDHALDLRRERGGRAGGMPRPLHCQLCGIGWRQGEWCPGRQRWRTIGRPATEVLRSEPREYHEARRGDRYTSGEMPHWSRNHRLDESENHTADAEQDQRSARTLHQGGSNFPSASTRGSASAKGAR